MALPVILLSLLSVVYPVHIFFFVLGFVLAYYCVPKRYTKLEKIDKVLARIRKTATCLESINDETKRQSGEDVTKENIQKLELTMLSLNADQFEAEVLSRKELTHNILMYYQQMICPFVSTKCEGFRNYDREEMDELKKIYESIASKDFVFHKVSENLSKFSDAMEGHIQTFLKGHKDKLSELVATRKNLMDRLAYMQAKIDEKAGYPTELRYEFTNLEFIVVSHNSKVQDWVQETLLETSKMFVKLFEELDNTKNEVFNDSPVTRPSILQPSTCGSNKRMSYRINEVHMQATCIYNNLKSDVKGLLGLDSEASSRQKHIKKYKIICRLIEQSIKQALECLAEFRQDKNRVKDDFGAFEQLEVDTKMISDKLQAFRLHYKILKKSRFESDSQMLSTVKLLSDILDIIVSILKRDVVYCFAAINQDKLIPQLGKKMLSKGSSILQDPKHRCNCNDAYATLANSSETELVYFFNKLMKIFFKEWAVNDIFKQKLTRKFERKLNKKPIPNFSLIKVSKISLTEEPMVIRDFKIVKDEDFLMAYDMHVVYQGMFSIVLETEISVKTKLVS